jgi:hypothetical protein
MPKLYLNRAEMPHKVIEPRFSDTRGYGNVSKKITKNFGGSEVAHIDGENRRETQLLPSL